MLEVEFELNMCGVVEEISDQGMLILPPFGPWDEQPLRRVVLATWMKWLCSKGGGCPRGRYAGRSLHKCAAPATPRTGALNWENADHDLLNEEHITDTWGVSGINWGQAVHSLCIWAPTLGKWKLWGHFDGQFQYPHTKEVESQDLLQIPDVGVGEGVREPEKGQSSVPGRSRW